VRIYDFEQEQKPLSSSPYTAARGASQLVAFRVKSVPAHLKRVKR